MNCFHASAVALAAALVSTGTAGAGPMLTGTVTYDRVTQLYTYTYTLDDRSAPGAVDVVEIRIATHVYDLFHLNSISHAAPAPFTDFYTAVGGWDTPEFPGGTFYEWHAWEALPGIHSGLSFTSRHGPGTGDIANYALFSSAVTMPPLNLPDGFVEYGRVVAADLTNAPEPGALVLGIVGLVAFGLRGLRHSVRAVRSSP